jgi:hypothetical protein
VRKLIAAFILAALPAAGCDDKGREKYTVQTLNPDGSVGREWKGASKPHSYDNSSFEFKDADGKTVKIYGQVVVANQE